MLFVRVFCSGATKECAWRTAPVRKAWTEVGVCGPPGRSAAGRVEAASPLPSDTATAPGTEFTNSNDSEESFATFASVLPRAHKHVCAFHWELRQTDRNICKTNSKSTNNWATLNVVDLFGPVTLRGQQIFPVGSFPGRCVKFIGET